MRLMLTKPPRSPPPASLPREIKFRPPASLVINKRNARVHPKRQIRKIANSIAAFGQLVPIVIDENGVVLKGHATLEAAKTLKLATVPTVTVSGLSEERKRAFMIADNRSAQDAGWNYEILAREFDELADLLQPIELDLTITGFEPAEIDFVLADRGDSNSDPGDALPDFL